MPQQRNQNLSRRRRVLQRRRTIDVFFLGFQKAREWDPGSVRWPWVLLRFTGLASEVLTEPTGAGPALGLSCGLTEGVSLRACWVTFQSVIMEKEQSGDHKFQRTPWCNPFRTQCQRLPAAGQSLLPPCGHARICRLPPVRPGPQNWMEVFILPRFSLPVL